MTEEISSSSASSAAHPVSIEEKIMMENEVIFAKESVFSESEQEEEDQEQQSKIKANRCLTEKQRQVVVAICGTALSALMTFLLIYLLNSIRGE